MCGIVGYCGRRNATEVVIEGLSRLEYRGYDSAGVGIISGGRLEVVRKSGRLSALRKELESGPPKGSIGIGHTRWATHGPPTDRNAHPHCDCGGQIAVVHNGIIENFVEIRERLEASGHEFRSDTDTEVIAHLIEENFSGDLASAVRVAVAGLEGAFSIAVASSADPEAIVGARVFAPLVVGLGEGESFLASDIPALLPFTRRVLPLSDGDVVCLRRGEVTVTRTDGTVVDHEPYDVDWDVDAAERGGFESFMLKEIYEQPQALRDSLLNRWDPTGKVVLDEMRLAEEEIRGFNKIFIVACGSAFHAGLVAKYAIEHWCRIPVEVEIASEFQYRDPVLDRSTLVLAISQSGETLDTMGAVRHARAQRAKVIAITNIVGSSIARESDAVLYTRAGPEVAVAATKTLVTQMAALDCVALFLAQILGNKYPSECLGLLDEMSRIPGLIQQCIDRTSDVRFVADAISEAPMTLFIGRHLGYPVSLEGALKLKEIAYVHASGYPAAELKHGPIALIENNVPVIAVATKSHVYPKMLSNLQEVKARGARLIVVANDGDHKAAEMADHVLWVPDTEELFAPMVNVIPLQLLAYYVGHNRGLDVDHPRNLAKTVTVE